MNEPTFVPSLTKSDLIGKLSKNQGNFIHEDVKLVKNCESVLKNNK